MLPCQMFKDIQFTCGSPARVEVLLGVDILTGGIDGVGVLPGVEVLLGMEMIHLP